MAAFDPVFCRAKQSIELGDKLNCDFHFNIPGFPTSAVGVRRGKAAFFSGCKSHPATIAPAGSNQSRHGGNEVAEASGVEGHIW